MNRDPEEIRSFPPLGPAIKVLMVWPRFPASFWSLGEVMEIVPERSLVPPLGLITVAALCPRQWKIRLVDLAFDQLALNKYSFMSVQFSRGCPFTCEFCDIITLYGRRPRTKSPAQLIGELDALLQLSWRKEVFIVDDNFIGNHKAALELTCELERWQRCKRYPFGFFTEASIDLASRPGLLDAMVKANFCRVFIGIESPSAESLKEAKKFQNLRRDPLDSIHFIQQRGLWVMGGFIVGFDSD